jgi:hypothetical protein
LSKPRAARNRAKSVVLLHGTGHFPENSVRMRTPRIIPARRRLPNMSPLHHSITRRFVLFAALLLISGSLLAARHPTPRPRIITREFLNRLFTQEGAHAARIVPHFVDGKPRGLRLYAIRPGGLFDQLGLRNGDSLLALDGFDLSSPDSALEAYAHMRGTSHLILDLERSGERVTLEYLVQ